MYASKYFNLDSMPHGWEKEEFRRAVETLESLSLPALREMASQFEIVFSNENSSPDEEDIISALFDDVEKSQLLSAL